MSDLPKKLKQKLENRKIDNTLRSLSSSNNLIDFSSNDYLGFAKNELLYANSFQLLSNKEISKNGATGSRLLSGNHELYGDLESFLAYFHKSDDALVFNSGYDANIGFFSAVPQRGDVVFYDEYAHASIRDGIKMGNAKSHKFKHNDLEDLKLVIERVALGLSKGSRNTVEKGKNTEFYVVTESVFSMDGDSPDLKAMVKFCSENSVHLIVDEAHALGVLGKKGVGLIHELGIEKQVLARIVTFGKALGCHGAAILCGVELKKFLLNFARSFIYTTGLPPHSIATILSAYEFLESFEGEIETRLLSDNILHFKTKLKDLGIARYFISSDSAIQSCIISGNKAVKTISKKLNDKGFDVKPILSPTVPEGEERLRFCLHSFNGKQEIGYVLQFLKKYI